MTRAVPPGVADLTEDYTTDALDRAMERYQGFLLETEDFATPIGILLWEELTGKTSDYTASMRRIDDGLKAAAHRRTLS